MDIAAASRDLNTLAYGYISSWALLTACEHRLFDRLPATIADLSDEYPDPALLETWLRVLEQSGVILETGGSWTAPQAINRLLAGENSYAEYLGGQVLGQMTPRIVLGHPGENELGRVLRQPDTRTGYEGWFADADEARRYQASQFAGSLGPARTIAAMVQPGGRVLDLGGGWGAVASAVARAHDVSVDVVDLAPVIEAAPPAEGVRFVAGSALEPDTWPDDHLYDGVILSYLLSSVPGAAHQPLLDALTNRGVRWVAIHDFMLGGGALAAAWSLQHAVFVPGHHSRTVDEVSGMLAAAGLTSVTSAAVVDEMTTMVLAEP